jgi:hypothetical protein
MSDIAGEPSHAFFSHVRRALGALGLAALGAAVLVGLIPLIGGKPQQPPVSKTAPAPGLPPPQVAR